MLVLDQFLPDFPERSRILTTIDATIRWDTQFVALGDLGVENVTNVLGQASEVENRRSGKKAPGDDEEDSE